MSPVKFCTGCGKGLTYDDQQAGYCPGCGKAVAGAPVPPRPATRPRRRDDEDDRGDATTMDRRDLLGWGTTRAALALVFVGLILLPVGLVLWWFMANRGPGQASTVLEVVVAFLAFVFGAAGASLTLAGLFMSCAVPDASGARGWGIGFAVSVVLLVVLFFVSLAAAPVVVGGPGAPRGPFLPTESRVLFYLTVLVLVLCDLFYLLYLRAVAVYFHRGGLGVAILVYLFVDVVLLALALLSLEGRLRINLDPVTLLVLVLSVGVGMLVWFLVLIGLTRAAVTAGFLRSLS